MKNERRHELQHNELVDQIEKARHWIEPYLVPGLVGVIAVTLVAIVVSFVQNQSSSKRSEATLDLLFSTAMQPGIGEDPESYDRVVTAFGDTASAEIAALAKADLFLTSGIDALFTDREEAKGKLDDAVKAYQQVIAETKVPLLRTRASLGLAQACESQGKLEDAIKAYGEVIANNESEALTTVAKRRIAVLEKSSTQEFVTWFDAQKPTAFDPALPPGLPGTGALPDFPDINLPGVLPPTDATSNAPATESTSPLGITEMLNQAGGGATTTETAPATDFTVPEGTPETAAETETPAGITPPATETPATETPATETPATETPATETPATESPQP